MNIALTIVRWLLAIAISAALSAWIFLATTNATIANREVVKTWLAGSGVYASALGGMFEITTNESNIVTSDVLKQALVGTFDADFLKQSANTVIDATYDWVDGTAPAITFSLPVHEKSDEFSQNLYTAILPKIEALPACSGRTAPTNPKNITCIPNGVRPSDYARQLIQPSSSGSFLSEPITHETVKDIPALPWIPESVKLLHILLWALPVSLAIMAGLYVWASPQKMRGLSHVARRMTIGAAVTLIGGLFLWYTTTAIDLSTSAGDTQQAAIVNSLINPLARTVLPDVGKALSLYSGIVVAIGGITWLGVFIWRHKYAHKTPQTPTLPPPPATPRESELPSPLNRP